MSYLEYNIKRAPSGLSKVLYLNWALIILLTAVVCMGLLQLYSVAGGSLYPWVDPQAKRFALGMGVMFVVAMIPIRFWHGVSGLAYLASLGLLLAVEFFGVVGMGAQRWIDLGFMRLQPSEVTKITLVMALAAYYDWLPLSKVSRPLWMIPPILVSPLK